MTNETTTIYGVFDYGELVRLHASLASAEAFRDRLRADLEEEWRAGITVEPLNLFP